MKILFFYLVVLITYTSCDQHVNKKELAPEVEHRGGEEPAAKASILNIDPRITRADSLVFVFYKNPHGADSLRYTRYYTQLPVTDTAVISLFRLQLMENTTKLEKVKGCRSEGKVWCFEKGEIFQTLYFSSKNQACSFIYLIRDGAFFYSPMPADLSEQLSALKQESVEIE